MDSREGTLLIILSVLLAGCNGVAIQSAETQPGDSGASDLSAQVTFPSCTEAHIGASSYDMVLIRVHGGDTVDFSGDFSGNQTVQTQQPIREVFVLDGDRGMSAENPIYGPCTRPETPTPTSTSTTGSSAEETPTADPQPTPAILSTPTPQSGPESQVNAWVEFTGPRISIFLNKTTDAVPDMYVWIHVEYTASDESARVLVNNETFLVRDDEPISYQYYIDVDDGEDVVVESAEIEITAASPID